LILTSALVVLLSTLLARLTAFSVPLPLSLVAVAALLALVPLVSLLALLISLTLAAALTLVARVVCHGLSFGFVVTRQVTQNPSSLLMSFRTGFCW
jgi:hypothetical protein